MKLDGNVAPVTGGAQGIGLSTPPGESHIGPA